MEMKDFLELKALEGNGMSPYEQYKVGYMQTKSRTSGVAIAGLVLGTVGTAAAIGSWVFSPIYGAAKANQAKEVAIAAKELANAQIAQTNATLDRVVRALERETDARVSGDVTLNQTITDTVSGSQQGTLTAQQAAELSSVNSVMQQTFNDFVTGRASLNPTPVSIFSAPQPCACPGCGCNG